MLSSDKKVCNLLSKLERNPGWPTVPSENKTTRETSSKGKKWLELRSVSASTAFLKSHYFAFESCSRKAVVVAQLIDRSLPITENRGLNTNIGKVLSTNCLLPKQMLLLKELCAFEANKMRYNSSLPPPPI